MEKEIIKLYYGFYNGIMYTQKEIASRFGLDQPRVSRIKKRALKKLRKELELQEEIHLIEKGNSKKLQL